MNTRVEFPGTFFLSLLLPSASRPLYHLELSLAVSCRSSRRRWFYGGVSNWLVGQDGTGGHRMGILHNCNRRGAIAWPSRASRFLKREEWGNPQTGRLWRRRGPGGRQPQPAGVPDGEACGTEMCARLPKASRKRRFGSLTFTKAS